MLVYQRVTIKEMVWYPSRPILASPAVTLDCRYVVYPQNGLSSDWQFIGICPSIHPSLRLSTYLQYPSMYSSIDLSSCLPIYLPTYLSTYLPIYLSTYLSISLSFHLSIFIPFQPILSPLFIFPCLTRKSTDPQVVHENFGIVEGLMTTVHAIWLQNTQLGTEL